MTKTKKGKKIEKNRQTIPNELVKNVIRKIILSQDYRTDLLAFINSVFLEVSIDFFGKVAEAKLRNKEITVDWYKKEFLNSSLSIAELSTNSGLNEKTIKNIYGNTKKGVVLDVSQGHYNELLAVIEKLVSEMNYQGQQIEITLTIKLNGVACDLTVSESLIVINTLAVKRAALRGGVWSSIGFQAEKLLVETLCRVFEVEPKYYDQTNNPAKRDEKRQVDFYLTDSKGQKHGCEVKLQGRGNPESTDGALARPDTEVFIFDSLHEGAAMEQLKSREDITWVQLSEKEGYKKFKEALTRFDIPFTEPEKSIEEILDELLKEDVILLTETEELETVEKANE